MKETIDIGGMSCQHCVRAVQGALARIDGVVVHHVDIGSAIVERRDEVNPDRLREAIAEEGYVVTAVHSGE